MKSSDRAILLVVPMLALAVGFYLLAIAPKRADISEMNTKIDDLNAQISDASNSSAAAEAARDSYDDNYADIVKLGAAAPDDNDQASFVDSMTGLAQQNSVQLRSWELASTGDIAPPTPPTPAPTTTPSTGSTTTPSTGTTTTPSTGSTGTTPPSTTGTPTSATTPTAGSTPTEAAVSTLPLGATVGPAGLPLTPYSFNYEGTFFDVANLLGDLDSTVSVSDSPDLTVQPTVRGRLVTVDGFALINSSRGFPHITATLALTSYSVPADQGLSAGATPAGPPTIAAEQTGTVTGAPQATTATVTP